MTKTYTDCQGNTITLAAPGDKNVKIWVETHYYSYVGNPRSHYEGEAMDGLIIPTVYATYEDALKEIDSLECDGVPTLYGDKYATDNYYIVNAVRTK